MSQGVTEIALDAKTESEGSSDSTSPPAVVEKNSDESPAVVEKNFDESPVNDNGSNGFDEAAEFRKKWHQASKVLFGLILSLAVIVMAIAIWQLARNHSSKHVIVWSVAAFFVSLAVTIAFHAINLNIIYYRRPLQRHYIRVLWMVPIYAIESWLALRFNESRFYLVTAREAYEGYVIYSCFSLFREFLGQTREEQVRALEKLKETHHREHAHHIRAVFLCFTDLLPKWEFGEEFLRNTSFGVLQFVPVQIIFAFLTLICANIRTTDPCYLESAHRSLLLPYQDPLRRSDVNLTLLNVTSAAEGELVCPNYLGEGGYSWRRLNVYKVIAITLCQTWAVYNMILFYHEAETLLTRINPLRKMLAVKGVVFVAFWQHCVIEGAVSVHWVKGYSLLSYSPEEVAAGLQNFMICVEMTIAACIMYWAFSHTDFSEEDGKALPVKEALHGMMVPKDLVKETVEEGRKIVKVGVDTSRDMVKSGFDASRQLAAAAAAAVPLRSSGGGGGAPVEGGGDPASRVEEGGGGGGGGGLAVQQPK